MLNHISVIRSFVFVSTFLGGISLIGISLFIADLIINPETSQIPSLILF